MALTVERFIALRVIPVLRLSSREKARIAIECLVEAGYGTVEITLTTPGALDLISELKTEVGGDFLIGAGTVLDADAARASLDAGADYLVSPCLVPGMAAIARDAGALALCGGFTPSEVLAAWRDGASIVKVFPAATGGPVHLGALHAVFPQIPLCPTGGVAASNIMEYFRAGAAVVGVGNNIIDQKALFAGDRAGVIEHAGSFLEIAGNESR